ncbi:Ger(x)C family spore germination protein [Clostridium aestuarii]|uniref:Ger(X)C family spore germination protein n=1 Tax=Clostridium aestuarii TaxID=338193 RepID=A0ABT4CZ70_9CLOT|nr:Ger(x)C family spore germination protein [Clostridium aestuarii]MCY6484278.1 Ger(x)C family spore germination protein [Clostridium aestuarii]
MKKIICFFIIIIMNSVFIVGCFSYKDINKVLFVTSVFVDINKNNNNPIMYVEAFKANIGGENEAGKDERLIFKGTGKTLLETVRDIALGSSFKLDYTQNKVVVFTQRAAEYGLDNFVDFFDRDQELLIRSYIAICIDDPEKIIKPNYKEENYVGIYIRELIDNIGASSRAMELPLNEFYNQRLIGDKINIVTIIQKKKDVLQNQIEISGGAIIKDDKMVGVIKREEGQGFNFMMNSVKSGTLEPANPQENNKFITLEILNSKTNTKIEYDEKGIKLIKNIRVKTSLAEVQKQFTINDRSLKQLEQTTENNIKKACYNIFYKFKDENLDVFDITEELYRKYPEKKVENIMEIIDLIVNVDVKVESANDTLNFGK